jgi:hypothetical protein
VGRELGVIRHSWRECRLAYLDGSGGRSAWAMSADQLKLEMAWSLVPDRDRRLFHEFCCLERHDEEAASAVHRVQQALLPALDLG